MSVCLKGKLYILQQMTIPFEHDTESWKYCYYTTVASSDTTSAEQKDWLIRAWQYAYTAPSYKDSLVACVCKKGQHGLCKARSYWKLVTNTYAHNTGQHFLLTEVIATWVRAEHTHTFTVRYPTNGACWLALAGKLAQHVQTNCPSHLQHVHYQHLSNPPCSFFDTYTLLIATHTFWLKQVFKNIHIYMHTCVSIVQLYRKTYIHWLNVMYCESLWQGDYNRIQGPVS